MAKKKADPTVKKRLKAGRVAALDLLIEEGGGGGTAIAALPEFDPEKGVGAPDFESSDDFNVEKILNESGEASIPVDLKFDDSSMPTAKNFFEWVSSSNYLAATPYLEQALIGIRLFGEYCPSPECSDTEWMLTENHEPSEGIVGLLNKVTLLEHGVCPKCGAKRSLLFKKRKLNLYNELAVCAGQRCVTGSTLLTTDMGLRRVRDLPVNGDDSVMSDLNVMLNNKACRVHKVLKDTDCNRLVAANLSNGMSLRGTADHGVEGWAFSYRPLSDCGRSPIVVNLGTHDSKPFPTKEFVLGLHAKYKTSGAVTRGAHFSCGEDFMLPVIADLAKGSVRVVGNRPYLDGDGVTLSRNIVLQHLVAAHMRDGVLAELPDYVLTQPRETLAVFFASLFELGEVTVVSEQLARDIQILAVGCNQPIVRDGCTLIRDREAYDDFSPLAETVQRVCPEFAPSAWDRSTLVKLLADVQESDPLYYLKRLVDGKFAVFTAEVEHIEPEPVWTFEVPSGQRYVSNGMVSENSGKSIVVAMLSTYITHLLLKVQKPTRLFNVGDNQILHGTFVALTLAQAKDTLWDPYYGYLLDSPWFQRYHALIRRLEALHGVEVLKLRDTFVLYRHRNLYVYAAGPDKRVLRGRCVTGTTMLNTNRGFLHFDELVTGKSGFKKARDLTVDSHKGTRKVSHTYKDRSKTINVTTRNGYNVEGTPEHPMLVLTRRLELVWRRLDEMQVGDRIVSRTYRSTPLFGTQQVDRDAATLAGYLVANGYGNTISSDDPEVVSTLYETFERLTGHSVTTTAGEAGVRASVHKLSINNRGRNGSFISNYMEPLGYVDVGSAHKSIPVSIRCASAEILHEFLEAYFQCDSGINGGSTSGSRSNAPCEIEVGSASKKLAQQLHIILLQVYGIVGRLRTRVLYDKLDRETGKFDAKRTHHLITITGGDAWKFLQAFKRAKVQKYADRFRDVPLGYMSDRRNVPYVREYVYNVFEDARKVDDTGKRLRKYVASDGSAFSWPNECKPKALRHIRGGHDLSGLDTPEFLFYGDDWEPTLQLMQQIDQKAARRVRKLLKLGAHFEEVTDIVYGSKEKLVYDITVPKGHAFTANGLASHNTRFLAAIDEIGYFDNNAAAQKVKTGAAEVHIALERSLLTVRANEQRLVDEGYDNLLTGYMLNVSSPSDYRDKICELVRLSQSSRKILGIHAPTWKMNPHIPRDNEIIVDAFQRDPMTAARDYGAQPPVSASPFISPVVVNDTMREVGRNEVEYTHQINRASNAGIQERTIYGVVTRIKETDVPSVLAIDAGETNNSFALSCTSTRDGMASIDLLIEIMPAPGVALNYTMIFDYLIVPVIKARNVRILLADRWNSTKLLQDALATSLVDVSKKYSLKYNDMWDVKNQMQGGTLSYPRSTHVKSVTDILNSDLSDYPECFKGRPVEHFMYQCVTIQDSRNQVLKGQGLTDDLWRATALSVYGLNNPDWAPFLVPRKNTNMNRDPSRLMVMGAGQRTAGGGSSVATKSGEVGNFACVAGSRRLKR